MTLFYSMLNTLLQRIPQEWGKFQHGPPLSAGPSGGAAGGVLGVHSGSEPQQWRTWVLEINTVLVKKLKLIKSLALWTNNIIMIRFILAIWHILTLNSDLLRNISCCIYSKLFHWLMITTIQLIFNNAFFKHWTSSIIFIISKLLKIMHLYAYLPALVIDLININEKAFFSIFNRNDQICTCLKNTYHRICI